MQVIGSDKFKYYPVRFDDVIVPYGQITGICRRRGERCGNSIENVEILTIDGNCHYPTDLTFERACEIYKEEFKEC